MDLQSRSETDACIPFSMLVPSITTQPLDVPASYSKAREARLREFLRGRPKMLAMADTYTTTTKITHCDEDTTVHDGNNTYTMRDEKQDDTEQERIQID